MTNFDRICRLCLEEKPILTPLFTDENLPSRIMTVSPSVKISPDDGLPSQICSKCVWLANSSFRFHMQCRISQIELDNHQAGNQVNQANKVKQISTTKDVRNIRGICVPLNQMETLVKNNQAVQTDTQTRKNASTMTSKEYVLPYAMEFPRQWCAYIQCNYITKDNVFVQALNEVITKHSNIHFPETQGRHIYKMDMTVRVLLNPWRPKNLIPLVDLTSDEEENAVLVTKCPYNDIAVQTEISHKAEQTDINNKKEETDISSKTEQMNNVDIGVTMLTKKSCLKRTENVDVGITTTKKVRFSEPAQEDEEEEIIVSFREKLAQCTTCKRVLESNMDFVQFVEHLKEHGQEGIICLKCEQSFDNPKHMHTHLQECKQKYDFYLTDFNKSQTQLARNGHTYSSHKDTRRKVHCPQICEFCEKTFTEAYLLLDHIRLHFPYNGEEDNSDNEML